VLIGASMGGAVAYEMAQQLLRAGQPVGLLMLLDTTAASPDTQQTLDDADILTFWAAGIVQLAPEALRRLSLDEQLIYFQQQTQQAQSTGSRALPTGSLSQLRRLLAVFKANLYALQTYRPQPYPAPFFYIRARDSTVSESPDSEKAWAEWAEGGITIDTVEGNHYTMLDTPQVDAIGRLITQMLGRIA
jgi:thioesterase domain-containing protein